MGQRGKPPRYLSIPGPPESILDEAICGPQSAHLFDEPHGREEDRFERHSQARRICNGTPDTPACGVRTSCLLWALENDALGVYGGEVVTPRMLTKYKRAKLKVSV